MLETAVSVAGVLSLSLIPAIAVMLVLGACAGRTEGPDGAALVGTMLWISLIVYVVSVVALFWWLA